MFKLSFEISNFEINNAEELAEAFDMLSAMLLRSAGGSVTLLCTEPSPYLKSYTISRSSGASTPDEAAMEMPEPEPKPEPEPEPEPKPEPKRKTRKRRSPAKVKAAASVDDQQNLTPVVPLEPELEPEPEPEPEFDREVSEIVPPPTQDELREIGSAFMAKCGLEATLKLMQEFGVEKLSKLPEEKYSEVYRAFQRGLDDND